LPKKAARAKQVKELAVTTVANEAEVLRDRVARAAEAARQFAIDSARIMKEDQCEDILILDLRGISPICDFFVIGTGTSDRQMRAVVDHVEELGRSHGEKPYGVAGYEEGIWIVVDYVDVVIHLFDSDRRGYYDLESLWGDSPRVDWACGTG
jgi:ribosome-associated protein